MSKEIYWLTLTVLMTGLFWVPYILNRFKERGVLETALDPNPDPGPKAVWAKRMMKAHTNAVENLVVFAPLVLLVQMTGMNNATTGTAVMVYFYARLVHFGGYTFGVPGVRTLTFVIGFVCQLTLALTLLQVV